MARTGRIRHFADDFSRVCVEGYRLVIIAVDDEALQREISAAARAAGILVNVVDRPSLCSFIVPALVDREPVLVAISTGGAAPVLGRLLRQRVESLLPGNFGRLAALAGEFRSAVKRAIADPLQRQRLWERTLAGREPRYPTRYTSSCSRTRWETCSPTS